MNRYRYLSLPAYLVATALIVIPFADTALSLYPWRVDAAQWRFGAVGLMSNAFMVPCVGLLILFVTALLQGHGRTLRFFGFACATLAVITALSVGLFALDAVQASGNVQDAAKLSYKVASVTAVFKLLLATATLSAFAIAGLRTPRERERASTATVRPVMGSVVANVG